MSLEQPRVGHKVRTQIKNWIMMQLGAPVIKVELTEMQVDASIDSAIEIYSQWANWENIGFFTTEPGVNIYDLSVFFPNFLTVRDVIYTPNSTDTYLQGFFSDFNFDDRQFFWYHSSYATMTDYTILNAYNEMYNRVIGIEGQWQMYGTKLELSPVPRKIIKVAVRYIGFPDDLDVRRLEWIKKYALAECKVQLGRIRSKYGSLPGPRGELSLDGDTLVSEGREEMNQLKEQLVNEFSFPPLFTTG